MIPLACLKKTENKVEQEHGSNEITRGARFFFRKPGAKQRVKQKRETENHKKKNHTHEAWISVQLEGSTILGTRKFLPDDY